MVAFLQRTLTMAHRIRLSLLYECKQMRKSDLWYGNVSEQYLLLCEDKRCIMYKWKRLTKTYQEQVGKDVPRRTKKQVGQNLPGMHPTTAYFAPNNRIHAPNRSIDMHPKGIDMHPKVSICMHPTTAYFPPNRSIDTHPKGIHLHPKGIDFAPKSSHRFAPRFLV